MKKFISVALIFMVSFHVSAQKKDTLLIDAGSLKASKLGSRTIIPRTEINNLFK